MSTEAQANAIHPEAMSMSIEASAAGITKQDEIQDYAVTSAHTTGNDSWQQVGLLLVTGFCSGLILSLSSLMLVPLSWGWGITCLALVGLFTAYSNWVLAEFHFIKGQRFIRYKDIMGYLFGSQMYYVTWASQFFTLDLANVSFILLGGRALKDINSALSESPMRLQYWIIITGVAYFLFAMLVPNMSSMRLWLGVSALLSVGYIVPLLVLLAKDGKSNRNRDYEIRGNTVDKVFNGLGAISAIIVSNTTGMLLEIQSTLRKPAVRNMRKALSLQYTAGLMLYYGVSIMGYWAYGSNVSDYLPTELSRPKWAKVYINLLVFLQNIVSQHMFAQPIHEVLDTKFLNPDEAIHSSKNLKRRFFLRTLFFTVNTLLAAAIPFIGDFINLVGSLTLVPLTFIFPSMIYIKVKGNTVHVAKRAWHLFIIVIFSLIGVATTISAIRLIVNDISTYRFFANT